MVGAAVGAGLRYWIGLLLSGWSGGYATLAVNVLGSFLIGGLYGSASGRLWLMMGIGFCGSLTTFSTFSWEVWELIRQHHYGRVIAYVGAMHSLCLGAVALGMYANATFNLFQLFKK